MQLVKQQGGKVAIARQLRGAAPEFHIFRILRVVAEGLSRAARTNLKWFHSLGAILRR